jgi:putative tryptophan/tyrosine transport system substrate-binding protein
MRRRDFIVGFGSAVPWPITARAQQSVMPVIGFLSSGTPGQIAPVVASLMQVLKEAGFNEGRTTLGEQSV